MTRATLITYAMLAFELSALVLTGCNHHTPSASAPGEERSTTVVEKVTVGKPARKSLTRTTTQPGRIEAYESTPIHSKIAGYVDEVAVDIGDIVKKGAVLIRLSVPEMEDDLEQNEALVAQAESEIKQAEAAVASAEAEVLTAEANREQALSGIDAAAAVRSRWESEHKRVSELAANGSVTSKLADETQSQYRAAEASWKQANASVSAANASVTQAKAKVAKAEADLDAVKARLRVAKANLSRVKTMRNYTEIRSPFDGVISRREVDTGHFVLPASGNTKPLLIVSRTDRVRIFVDIPEIEAAMVQGGPVGDTAVIRVQALGNKEFHAKVSRTAWSLDESNRSLRSEIEIANEGDLLRPGMYAMATIILEKRDNVLAIPVAAIARQGETRYCCRVDDGVIHRQVVELGLRAGEEVEVASGVGESDSIVLARTEGLKDGQAVEVSSPAVK